MATFYGTKVSVTSVTPTGKAEADYREYEVMVTVKIPLWAENEDEARKEAKQGMEHVLS